MDEIPDISVVVPVYGCDGALRPLYERVAAAVAEIPASFELILVDDRGPGRPWEIIGELADQDSRVRGLRLSRNFGQHNAISAGIEHARGNWLVLMDCDLQHRPEEIPRLWAKAREGFDYVVGRRTQRQDGLFKRLSSLAYHRLFAFMTDREKDAGEASFGIYSRRVVDAFKLLPEHSKAFTLLVHWLGFNSTMIDFPHEKRAEGKSSYTLSRMISLASDTIVSFSNKPLEMFVHVGFLMALFAFVFGLYFFVRYFFGHPPEGWTSVMVSLYFLSGILLFGMGVLGTYIGKVFNQVKGRPSYVVIARVGGLSGDDANEE